MSWDEIEGLQANHQGLAPKLEDVLQFISSYGREIIINAELKGKDPEGFSVVETTADVASCYLENNGGHLKSEQFVFVGTQDKGESLKTRNQDFKWAPLCLTGHIYDKIDENYDIIPGAVIRDDFIEYLETEQDKLDAISMFAKDVTPALIDECAKRGIGIIVNVEFSKVENEEVDDQLKLLLASGDKLPIIGIQADDTQMLKSYLRKLHDAPKVERSSFLSIRRLKR